MKEADCTNNKELLINNVHKHISSLKDKVETTTTIAGIALSSNISASDLAQKLSSSDASTNKLQLVSNLTTSIAAAASASDSKYPSEKAVRTELDKKENTSNKITSATDWGTPTTTQYPNAKLVKDTLDTKLDAADLPTTLPNAYNLIVKYTKSDNTEVSKTYNGSAEITITKTDLGLSAVTNDAQVKRSEMGVANGVATLGADGKVPSTQLPSFVDDVVEGYYKDSNNFYQGRTDTYSNQITAEEGKYYVDKRNEDIYTWNGTTFTKISELPTSSSFSDVIEGYYKSADGKFYTTITPSFTNKITGESGKIYVDLATDKTYRWSGSTYVLISDTIALGETSSTAYRGDRGKIAYDHATETKSGTVAQGFNKFSVTAQGHIGTTTAVAKSDINGVGIDASKVEVAARTGTVETNSLMKTASTAHCANNISVQSILENLDSRAASTATSLSTLSGSVGTFPTISEGPVKDANATTFGAAITALNSAAKTNADNISKIKTAVGLNDNLELSLATVSASTTTTAGPLNGKTTVKSALETTNTELATIKKTNSNQDTQIGKINTALTTNIGLTGDATNGYSFSAFSFESNATSALKLLDVSSSTSVKTIIEKVDSALTTNKTNISTNASNIESLQTAVGTWAGNATTGVIANKTTISEAITAIASKLDTISTDFDNSKLQDKTYAQLAAMITNSTLVPGTLYRITDYTTTTSTTGTRSAANNFDIIVQALTTNTINEDAKVAKRAGTTYFNSEDLGAWEIKYCVANDTTRFAWAISTGKGVIYYMKDEYGNEANYDFKNIQFLRDSAFKTSAGSAISEYLTVTDGYYYTFSHVNTSNAIVDISLQKTKSTLSCECFNNKILCYNKDNASPVLRELPNNIFVANAKSSLPNKGLSISNNTVYGYNNTFGGRNVFDNYFSGKVTDSSWSDAGQCNNNNITGVIYNSKVLGEFCNNTITGAILNTLIDTNFSYNNIVGTISNTNFSQSSNKASVFYCEFTGNYDYVTINCTGTAADQTISYYMFRGSFVGTSSTKISLSPEKRAVTVKTSRIIEPNNSNEVIDYCMADIFTLLTA